MTALLNRVTLLALLTTVLLLAFGLVVHLVVSRIDTMIDHAERTAIESRDAHWVAEIERTSAETNRRAAEHARAVLAIEADANARVRAAEEHLSQLETANAALPDGDACGLGRDRVRLLPQ